MRSLTIDIISIIAVLLGLILPFAGFICLMFCKYILHFCIECQYLHSQSLKMRIAMLERKYPQSSAYITMLKRQLHMYLCNPALDRETEKETICRLTKQARKKGD